MLVILAGAGASKSVNKDYYPTTVEFIEQLPEYIRENSLYQLSGRYLNESLGGKVIIDVEQMLWILKEIKDYYANMLNPPKSVKWFTQRSQNWSGVEINAPFQKILSQGNELGNKINILEDHLYQQVYDRYSNPPNDIELLNSWLPLLNNLFQDYKQRIDIITTNYDLVIEAAIYNLEKSKVPKRIDTGRTNGTIRTLNEDLWNVDNVSWNESRGLLTKLHGSVDWSRRNGDIYIGDPFFKGDHKRHVIIYPGFKGIPKEEPFVSFHNYFNSLINNTSILVVIGYSFRDDYINSILNNIRINTKVIVINPAEDIPDIPFTKKQYIHYKSIFNVESANLILSQVFIK